MSIDINHFSIAELAQPVEYACDRLRERISEIEALADKSSGESKALFQDSAESHRQTLEEFSKVLERLDLAQEYMGASYFKTLGRL